VVLFGTATPIVSLPTILSEGKVENLGGRGGSAPRAKKDGGRKEFCCIGSEHWATKRQMESGKDAHESSGAKTNRSDTTPNE